MRSSPARTCTSHGPSVGIGVAVGGAGVTVGRESVGRGVLVASTIGAVVRTVGGMPSVCIAAAVAVSLVDAAACEVNAAIGRMIKAIQMAAVSANSPANSRVSPREWTCDSRRSVSPN